MILVNPALKDIPSHSGIMGVRCVRSHACSEVPTQHGHGAFTCCAHVKHSSDCTIAQHLTQTCQAQRCHCSPYGCLRMSLCHSVELL